MTDEHYPDPAERDFLDQEDELLAALIGEYVAHREDGANAVLPDLLARAAEFGVDTRAKLEDLVVFYELHRLDLDT